MKLKFAALFFVLIFAVAETFAQGCSDAGICTINSLNADKLQTNLKNNVRIGIQNGKGDDGINIWGSYIEYYLNGTIPGLEIGGRINFISETSPSLSNQGLSDIFLTANYLMQSNFSFAAGIKLPLNDANEKFDSIDAGMPMGFQTSLGTFDLVLGAGYRIGGFRIDIGYQQPLNNNKNTYLSTDFPPGAPFGKYQSTNQFERKPDIMLRAAYEFAASKKFRIIPSVLPIFHLGEDKFTDSSGVVSAITGSDGLTLNANLMIEYIINKNNAIVLGGAVPLVTRDSRPDGLGRKYLLNLDFKIMF